MPHQSVSARGPGEAAERRVQQAEDADQDAGPGGQPDHRLRREPGEEQAAGGSAGERGGDLDAAADAEDGAVAARGVIRWIVAVSMAP